MLLLCQHNHHPPTHVTAQAPPPRPEMAQSLSNTSAITHILGSAAVAYTSPSIAEEGRHSLTTPPPTATSKSSIHPPTFNSRRTPTTSTMSDPLDILSTDPAVASHDAGAHDTVNLDASTGTFPSDSENYSPSTNASPSPPSSSSPLILYSPPTLWGLLRGAAINLILPFVNGLMLGFGELVANEAAYRLGWSGTKVRSDCTEGVRDRTGTDEHHRSSPPGEARAGASARASRCGRTPSRGGGGTGRSWTCTLRWSSISPTIKHVEMVE